MKNNKPKISLIIPVYNSEKYLPECLDSVLEQTFKDFEVVCVNDGSTDSSLSILKKYAAKDARIVIKSQNNAGVSAARNAALELAKGKYIAFLDSDDFIHPDYLKVLYETMELKKADLVWCGFLRVNQNILRQEVKVLVGKRYPIKVYDNIFDDFIKGNINPEVALWNKLYKSDLAKQIKFVENIAASEDFLYVVSYLYKTNKVAFVNAELLFYRVTDTGLTHKPVKAKYIEDHYNMCLYLNNFFKNETLKEDVRKALDERIAKTLFKASITWPYKRSAKDSYMDYWKIYCVKLLKMKENGIYKPELLNSIDRYKSDLYINKKFGLLRFLLLFT